LRKKKPIIFCGDLNVAHKEIDLANPKENEENPGFSIFEREAFDSQLDKGYVDTFRMFNDLPDQYTWWSYRFNARVRNVGWRIDYFLASESFAPKIKDAFIVNEVMGSDHCPVGIEI
jgi:exodeoxyribonuclease-3